MKKWILLTTICSLPLQLMAQDDDMYFVPTKENVAKEAENYGMPKKTYYSGSNRSIDDYNGRQSSSITPIDSTGQEVETEDYQYTRQLSRFDDYTPSQAYWEGYRDGRWMSPWYYGRYGWYSTWYDPWYISWYDPWYISWYDPWYYGGYYSWYSPWRYGWYRPYYHYYGGRSYRPSSHQRFHANRQSAFGNGFGRNRSTGSFGNRSNNGTFGNSSRSTINRTTTDNGRFNGSRNSTGFGSGNRSSSSNSSGSFGSSRSSSSSGGGSRGGSFGGGGGRSGGGGGRFGR